MEETVQIGVIGALLNAGCHGLATAPRWIEFASGMFSPVYIDNRRLLGDVLSRSIVARALLFEMLCELQRGNVPFSSYVLAAVETGATPLAAIVADHVGLPLATVRKVAKGHGQGKRVEGAAVAGKRVFLFEDHITTAGSALSAVAALRQEGAEVSRVFCITCYDFYKIPEHLGAVFEREGLVLHVMVPFSKLMEEAKRRGMYQQDEYGRLMAWLQDPWAWSRTHGKQS